MCGLPILVRSFVASLALAGIAIPAALGSGAAQTPTIYPTLYVNYALNCTFTITDGSGAAVTSIAPGTYEVTVTTPMMFSQAPIQNLAPGDYTGCRGYVQFQLTGPDVDLSTTLFNGCNSFEVLAASHFQPSATYVAQDNNNAAGTRTTFTTLASGTPVTPVAPYATSSTKPGTASTDVVGSGVAKGSSSAFRGTLDAAVRASGALSLIFKGKRVATLQAGRYSVAVTDRSSHAGFVLTEARRPSTTLTAGSFTGKRTVSVKLAAGQWSFATGAGGKKSYFLVVS